MSRSERSTKRRHVRVLVLTEMLFKPDRERLGGILRYAAIHPEWEVSVFPNHPANRQAVPSPDEFDGLITTDYFMRTIPGARRLARIRPAVIFGPNDIARGLEDEKSVAVFSEDNRAIGTAAAEFFLRKGLFSFGFVGTQQPRFWSDERRNGFAARLAKSGFAAVTHGREPLERFLLDLPKPCGVFAAFDIRAKDVLDACRTAGIAVPSQVGVLGVDNEDFICETVVPTLSSIENDIEGSAFQAAAELDEMMRGRSAKRPQVYGIRGIVERLSTSDLSGASRIVTIAKEFIRRNISTSITPLDVAIVCRVSLRLLQRSFAAVLNDSPANYIRRQRLALVCRMLVQTATPIDQVGRLCGFSNARHLKTIFLRHCGMTMSAYRKASHPTNRSAAVPKTASAADTSSDVP